MQGIVAEGKKEQQSISKKEADATIGSMSHPFLHLLRPTHDRYRYVCWYTFWLTQKMNHSRKEYKQIQIDEEYLRMFFSASSAASGWLKRYDCKAGGKLLSEILQ